MGVRLGLSGVSVLERHVVKELASHALAGFVVVLAIFLVTRLSALLSDAVVAALPGSVVALLLALRTVMALPSLLPAVLYLGVLLAINRLSRDSELLAMEACGVAPHRIDRTVLRFALCVACGIAVLSFAGRPWAAARFNQVRADAIAESGLDDITPGLFYELRSASREVVFAEARSLLEPEYLENVFVQRRTPTGITVFSARRAIESRDASAGYRSLILYDGIEYDIDPQGERHVITRFGTMSMHLPPQPEEPGLAEEKSLSLGALFATDDREASAEVQWRSAMPVSAVLLCLLAVPLGRTDPRRGRFARVFVAAILYVGYRTLLGTAKSWVADGILAPAPGLWLVHGACLLAVLGLGRAQRTVSP